MRTGVFLLTLMLAVGCASSGDLTTLTDRVSQLETRAQADAERIAQLESGFVEVRTAADRAAAAEAQAQAAASRADDAARRADAMFKKSVSK